MVTLWWNVVWIQFQCIAAFSKIALKRIFSFSTCFDVFDPVCDLNYFVFDSFSQKESLFINESKASTLHTPLHNIKLKKKFSNWEKIRYCIIFYFLLIINLLLLGRILFINVLLLRKARVNLLLLNFVKYLFIMNSNITIKMNWVPWKSNLQCDSY